MPTSNLSSSEKTLKKQYQEGLEAATQAQKKPMDTAQITAYTNADFMDVPFLRARAIIEELRQAQDFKSSVCTPVLKITNINKFYRHGVYFLLLRYIHRMVYIAPSLFYS